MALAAIVIPNHKFNLTKLEEISLRFLHKSLGNSFPIFLIQPKNFKNRETGAQKFLLRHSVKVKCVYFENYFFQNIEGYNFLLLSPEFYKRFLDHTYILIYQLDALILRENLFEWCNKGYDYIGSPWYDWELKELNGVGNGGLSLRNVSSHLKVLNTFSYVYSMGELKGMEFYRRSDFFKKILIQISSRTYRNNTHHLFNAFKENEDIFWGKYANRNFDWFKVPNEIEALDFSFECFPEKSYTLNGYKLPFGCHGWYKYNLDFWNSHLSEYLH